MNIKKVIIILSIMLIISLVILAILILFNNYQEKYEYDPPQENLPIQLEKNVTRVDTKNNYYAAKSCIEKYYLYLTKTDNSDYSIIDEEVEQTIAENEKIKKQAIYGMLDDNYIEARGITEENVFEQITEIEQSDIIIENMYVSQQTENIYAYFIDGKLRNQDTKEKTDFVIMIKMDMLNRTFEIVPTDYINEYVTEITIGQEISIDVEETIEKNSYNMFDYENISEEMYVTDMFNEFREEMIYDYEMAYENLDQEYKEKRFETYEEFENYAIDNIRNNVMMELTQYQVNNYDDYTQYVCVDQNGKYYIFNETSVMDYDLILDTYTIDLPQFIEQYNNATDAEKVLMNIQKVFAAINDGDYNYVYNKLDNTFKQNNFPTLENFETYIKENLYENNSISYTNYQTNANLHIYEINIKNTDDENSSVVTKNFIMQLLDGTDFVMSFNV